MTEHSSEHVAQIDPHAHRVLADVSRVAVLETLRRAGRPLAIPEIAAEVGLHPNTVRAHLALLVEHGYATGRTEDRERPGRPRLLYTATAKLGREEEGEDKRRNYRLLAEVLITYLTGNDPSAHSGAAAVAAGRAYGRRIAHEGVHTLGHRSDAEHGGEPGPDDTRDASGPTSPSGSGSASALGLEIGDETRTGLAALSDAGSGSGSGGASGALRGVDAAIATERIVALLTDAGFEPRLAPDGSHIDLHRCPFRELAEANPEVVCGVHLGLMQGALADLGAPITAASLRRFVRPGVCVVTFEPQDEEFR
ncbi:helix-turn-helix domain-containing protein [Thermopolyspora sp. NPDC052614]|uniref:helix-turn-helix transcriptional regulator n=1 Tax=Thermopolyspora sp. NPDC052614 TaxID=3155682 RepID=UPI003426E371